MANTAQKDKQVKKGKICVLITNIGSYLSATLAESLLLQNCQIYGLGTPERVKHLLTNPDFTLLELSLTQPLPSYLPQFDLIFYFDFLKNDSDPFLRFADRTSPALTNVLMGENKTETKVFVAYPLRANPEVYEYFLNSPGHKFLKILLIGDLYGPKMFASSKGQVETNELERLFKQAITSDKIVMDQEGLSAVYPTFITDAIFAINKFAFSQNSGQFHTIVSQEAKNCLSVSYDIQNAASLILNKNIGLFFASSTPQEAQQEASVKIHDLGFVPKVKLEEGLKRTFENPGKQLEHVPVRDADNEINATQISSKFDQAPKASTKIMERSSEKLAKIKAKLPKSSLIRPRNLLVALLLLLLLTITKTGLDLYLGIKGLKEVQKLALSGNLDDAHKKAQNAKKALWAAHNKTKILAIIPLGTFEETDHVIQAASYAADSSIYLVEGGQSLTKSFGVITSQEANSQGFDVESPQALFKKAHFSSSLAGELIENSGPILIGKSLFTQASDTINYINGISTSALELSYLLPELTGQGKPKRYLVLLTNNSELRPGGGFIGNFAEVEFENSKLKNIIVEDIYTIDGQLKENIEPPAELKEKLGVSRFYLRDSNWSPDFALNSATARDFFKKETGKDVDGVVAVDLSFMQEVLKVIGPIKLPDYNEEISADNLFERGEYHSEVGFFPGSTQKRDFFGNLSRNLIAKILGSLGEQARNSKSGAIGLVEVIRTSLSQKHIMLTFDSPILSSFAQSKGWNNQVPPLVFDPTDDTFQTRDFLALSEANLGANKVNRFIERSINYEITVGRDADLVAKLTIKYTNKSQAETWPAGKYINFLRVYVPMSSTLLSYKNGESTDASQVKTFPSGKLTTFATFVEVPIRSTKEVSLNYRIPKNIKLEKAPIYALYVQKQAGTEKDPFEFTINLPSYLQTKETKVQNQTEKTDLKTDRLFEVEVVKK